LFYHNSISDFSIWSQSKYGSSIATGTGIVTGPGTGTGPGINTTGAIPMRQCSLVFWKTAFWSMKVLLAGFFMLVFTQQMSSHRLQPHFLKHSLPTYTMIIRRFSIQLEGQMKGAGVS